MEQFYLIVFFIVGVCMGSFYHVVATRVSREESIIFPGSHCDKCMHKLKWYENIPIFSYVFLKGKCSSCKERIPASYLVVELVTGVLFAVSYHCFKFSYMQLVSLIFISSLVIVIVSDIEYMIILDEVLVIGTLLIIAVYTVFLVLNNGIKDGLMELALSHIYPAIGSFVTMYALKLFGDKVFQKESLGGGDIKLMFLLGLVLGYPLSICTIFLATFIAFPIALIIMFMDRENVIPFGPFLSMAGILIFISKVNINDIINFIIS